MNVGRQNADEYRGTSGCLGRRIRFAHSDAASKHANKCQTRSDGRTFRRFPVAERNRTGYDDRCGTAAAGHRMPSPLDQLREVVQAVSIPVQAVGGLSLEQTVQRPAYGAPLVVLGAPLTIDADVFKTASGNPEDSLRLICEKVHAFGDVKVGKARLASN